jgi:hypothetical protein
MNNIERIEELKRNEYLLYKVLEYLLALWSIDYTEEEQKEKFKRLGFTEEDIKRLEIYF